MGVITGLDPVIHVLLSSCANQTWMAGSSSAETRFALLPGYNDVELSRRRDRFQEAVDLGLQAAGRVGQLPGRRQQLVRCRAGLVGAMADFGDGAGDLGCSRRRPLDIA